MGLGVRKPALAGSFYPSSKEELLLMLKKLSGDHFWQTPLGKVKHLPVTSGVRSSRGRNEHSL